MYKLTNALTIIISNITSATVLAVHWITGNLENEKSSPFSKFEPQVHTSPGKVGRHFFKFLNQF